MSFSDNSTVAVSHDIDGFFKPTDESRYAYDEISGDALHTSPYVASKIYSLDVGSPASRFLVHSEILEKSSIPPSTVTFSANISLPISLPELDAATAHTLVHYLYSSNYHVPNSFTMDSNAQYRRYKHATCVYCAAVRYSVPGLESIAKQVMIYKGFGLSIFEILTVARDHGFPLLPESDTQYSEYLEESITQAMKEDPEPFRKPDFITNFGGNSRLLQVIWKTVMSNYAVPPAPSDLNAVTEIGAKTPLAESLTVEDDTAAQDSSLYQLPSPTESVADSGRAVPPQREGLELPDDLDLSAPTTQHAKSSIEASLDKPTQTEHTDAAMSDDFGLPAIEPTIELSEVSAPVTLPPTSMKKPGHVRADSVVEADLVPPKSTPHNETSITLGELLRRDPDITGASSTSPDPVATAAATSDNSVDHKRSITVGQLVQQLGGEHNDASKKNKKKSKKKHSSITF